MQVIRPQVIVAVGEDMTKTNHSSISLLFHMFLTIFPWTKNNIRERSKPIFQKGDRVSVNLCLIHTLTLKNYCFTVCGSSDYARKYDSCLQMEWCQSTGETWWWWSWGTSLFPLDLPWKCDRCGHKSTYIFTSGKFVLTLPHSNAKEEQVFSLIWQNKTDFRSTLS